MALALCVLVVGGETAWGQSTTRVSVASGGVQVFRCHSTVDAITRCNFPAISGDGRFVAFQHEASSLVPDDTNASDDVFLNDRFGGTLNAPRNITTRVSVASSNVQANSRSGTPAISADGRFVAFESDATNLIAGDTNSKADVFVRDRAIATTTRVSVASDGLQATGTSYDPAISADGRFVAFVSAARNLTAYDTNLHLNVFVHDRATATTTPASVQSGGRTTGASSFSPAISADGRFVAFTSRSRLLVADDFNDADDVFVHDRATATTTPVSVASGNVQANGHSGLPAISADGRFVAFQSAATNLVAGDNLGGFDVFVHDRATATTTRVSVASDGPQANGSSFNPAISADGRFVTFTSTATNLVAGDTNSKEDVFVHDRSTGNTTVVSVAQGSERTGNGRSDQPAISTDGRFVAFVSYASDLIAGDTNVGPDYFVRDRGVFAGFTGSWERVRLRCARRRPPRRCTVGGRLEITNPGNRTARASRVHFFLSTNRALDARDRLLRRLSLAPLKAGKTKTVALKRVLKRDVSGRFLIARLDATGKVKEPNERDNLVVSEPLSRRRIVVRIKGSAKRRARASITVRVTDANGRAIRNAAVSVSGAGLPPVTKRSGRRGRTTFRLPPLGKGTVEIRASRRGYATTTVYRRVLSSR